MEKLPKYVADLIELLDKEIEGPSLSDLSMSQWGTIDEATVRRMAFRAGQRSLVDILIGAQADVENENGDANSEADESEPSVFGRVFDPDGKERLDVASVHMAASMYGNERSGTGGDEG